MSSILITVCARGGSKGVLGKNIRPLLGKPLLLHTLDIAKEYSKRHENCPIYISTDSKDIAKVATDAGFSVPRMRSDHLSGDVIGKTPVIYNALLNAEKDFKTRFDFVLDLDVTSPLRNLDDIDGCVQMALKNPQYDVVLSVCESRRNPYFNMVEEIGGGKISLCKKGDFKTRQSSPKVYDLNASIYVYRRDFFETGEADRSCIGPNTGIYVMPASRSWDIDHEEDFAIMEALMEHNPAK